jgi:hypothetical protein
MRTALSSYALEDVEAVPADVGVDGDEATVDEPQNGGCHRSVKPHTTSSGASPPVHVVNTHTLAQGKLAPGRMRPEKSIHYTHSRYNSHFVKMCC